MAGLFAGCTSLENVDLSSFNTRKVEDIRSMFDNCQSLKTLDLSNFVLNFNNNNSDDYALNMFANCTSLETLYMGTVKSDSFSYMFGGLSSLKTLDIRNFDTSDCRSFYGMFVGCSSLEELDLSNFDTSKVDETRFMLADCSNLVSVYVGSGWSTDRMYGGYDMFTGCTSIVGQDGSVYDANCANDQRKAHYGPGGYLKFKGEQLPTDVSPIGAEKTVAFPTDGSLANTTVDDVYYNLTGDNGYDANEGCIVINESTTMTTGSDGGVRFSEFIGLKFMVNGKGVVDLDCQTYGRKRLYVMVGEGTEPKVYTADPRGIVEVSYDVTEPTNIYVYAMDEAAAPRMVEAKSDCVKLWSLTVKPGATAIAPVTAAEQAAGEYYTLDGRKLTGRPATAGVYVTGGRKVVVK
ncbi:MAG: BspA family leucine-rich repeat surface protein [Prevotella sp.]|nr:BspA family leucine-rich repeat surface protein [Prevotella sp.]